MVMHFFIWTIYLHVILGKTNPDFLSILSFCQCISSVNCFATLCDRSESSLAFLTPLQAILFDIDGTLCDSDPTHYNAFREMLQEVLFKISSFHVCCIFVLLHQLTQQVFHRQVSMEESPSLRNSLLRTSVACIMKSSVVSSYLIGISKEQENSWMIRKPSFGGNLIQPYTR